MDGPIPDKPCSSADTCKMEAILTIDDRGQIVIPKDVRENLNMRSGEKLALVSWNCGEETCCLVLIRSENLSGMVKDALSPLAQSLLRR